MYPSNSWIKKKILAYRSTHPEKPVDIETKKTISMRWIESKYRLPIEELVMDGGVREVARFLEVDPATISKWRRRLSL